jgi:hypothetical protein
MIWRGKLLTTQFLLSSAVGAIMDHHDAAADIVGSYIRKRQQLEPGFKFTDEICISIFDFPIELLPVQAASEGDRVACSDVVSVITDSEDSRGLTCRTCQLRFESRDIQGVHFKSPLHLVNLKRTLLSLPVITSETDISLEEISDDEVEGGSSDDETHTNMETSLALEEIEIEEDEFSFHNGVLETSEGRVTRQYFSSSGTLYTFHLSSSQWQFRVSSTILEHYRQGEAISSNLHAYFLVTCMKL